MATETVLAEDPSQRNRNISFLKELLAGLTVSFVAISLGAAFGVMSERGALVGILSAGVIALITAAFGGTRIQCSGPTAPMTAVTLVVIATIHSGLLQGHDETTPDHFINMILVLTGAILLLAAVFRLGRFINFVPRVVISGFMSGIAVLIWIGEAKTLFGLGGKEILAGGMLANIVVAALSLFVCFFLPPVLKHLCPKLSSFFPATLIAIVLITSMVHLFGISVQCVTLGASLNSVADVKQLIVTQFPTEWSLSLVWLALPFAIQLAMLAYLDTLLTSLVVDQKATKAFGKEERTAQNRELAAQGFANAAVSVFGGIPGAQATIRSVLILNEGAMTRLAGVIVGALVLVEMVLFQEWITTIPKAVFTGVLIKVGIDVFDWTPIREYCRAILIHLELGGHQEPSRQPVTHTHMIFIAGTTLVTVLVNLNVAVILFCVVFYVANCFRPIQDLTSD